MLKNKSGFALLYVFFFVIMLAGMIVAYLYMNSQNSASYGNKYAEGQAFYAAEAAQARAIQYLQNNGGAVWNTLIPAGTGDLATWYTGTTFGPITDTLTTKNLINYNFFIDVWNLAYSGNPTPFNGVTATASSTQAGNVPDRGIDGLTGNGQFWRSQPPFGASQWIQINFPAGANYTISACRFRSMQPGGNQIPSNYSWIITPVMGPPTTIGPFVNAAQEVCDFFTPVANVSTVQLNVTGVTGGASVRIDEIEIPWIRIKSRCQITNTSGTSFTEKTLRNCVLTNNRAAGATIRKIIPSTLSNTQMTAIWDEISNDNYNNPGQF